MFFRCAINCQLTLIDICGNYLNEEKYEGKSDRGINRLVFLRNKIKIKLFHNFCKRSCWTKGWWTFLSVPMAKKCSRTPSQAPKSNRDVCNWNGCSYSVLLRIYIRNYLLFQYYFMP
jgi:hypothetical protein